MNCLIMAIAKDNWDTYAIETVSCLIFVGVDQIKVGEFSLFTCSSCTFQLMAMLSR